MSMTERVTSARNKNFLDALEFYFLRNVEQLDSNRNLFKLAATNNFPASHN
jgi:hypothetical protein